MVLVCSCSSAMFCPSLSSSDSHSHLGHREKECADLMMYRKSEEPHNDPSAAIGRLCACESPAHSEPEPHREKTCRNTECGSTQDQLAHRTCSVLSARSTSPVTSEEVQEVSPRQDKRAGGLKPSASSSNPLKADGILVGGTKRAGNVGRLP